MTWVPPGFRLLFLARYAFREGEDEPPFHPDDGVFPKYHHEIGRILRSLDLRVEASRNLESLFGRLDVDYVFSLFNRATFRNSEVFVSAVCEYRGLPYLGAPPNVRAIAEDKQLGKVFADRLGIPTPRWVLVGDSLHTAEAEPKFEGPFFVKPRFGSASRGVSPESLVGTWERAVSRALQMADVEGCMMIEEFVPGRNVTVPIVGGLGPLPAMETVTEHPDQIVTYRMKRGLEPGARRTVLLEHPHLGLVTDQAYSLFQALQPLDYARFDFRMPADPGSPPMFLELNVCCNLGSHSNVAIPARELGIPQDELIRKILQYSFRRQGLIG